MYDDPIDLSSLLSPSEVLERRKNHPEAWRFNCKSALDALYGSLKAPPTYLFGEGLGQRVFGDTSGPQSFRSDSKNREGLVVWAGHIWDAMNKQPVVGAYFKPGLHCHDLVSFAQDEHQEGVADWGKGLGRGNVSTMTSIFFEADEGTIQEQLDAIRSFEDATGLRFGVMVYSGTKDPKIADAVDVLPDWIKEGKSIHVYLLLQTPIEVNKDSEEMIWVRLMRLLCVAMRGDPSVTEITRRMRLPGVVATLPGRHPMHGVRLQALVRPVSHDRYSVEEITSKIEAYLASEGVTDPDSSFRSLGLAFKLGKVKAKDETQEEAARALEALRLSRRIRASRVSSDQDDVTAKRLLGQSGQCQKGVIDPETKIQLADGREGTLDHLISVLNLKDEETVSCFCPAHANTRTPAAIISNKGGRPHVHCFAGCGTLRPEILVPDGLCTFGGSLLETRVVAPKPPQGVAPITTGVVTPEASKTPTAPKAIRTKRIETPEEKEARLRKFDQEWGRLSDEERAQKAQEREDLENAEAPYWAPLEERAQKNIKERESLPEETVRAVGHVRDLAKSWLPAFREFFAKNGLQKLGCGGQQMLANVRTKTMTSRHLFCRKLNCFTCGSLRMARQAAACVMMPAMKDRKVIGPSLEASPEVYIFEVSEDVFKEWKKHNFNKVEKTCTTTQLNSGLGSCSYRGTVTYIYTNKTLNRNVDTSVSGFDQWSERLRNSEAFAVRQVTPSHVEIKDGLPTLVLDTPNPAAPQLLRNLTGSDADSVSDPGDLVPMYAAFKSAGRVTVVTNCSRVPSVGGGCSKSKPRVPHQILKNGEGLRDFVLAQTFKTFSYYTPVDLDSPEITTFDDADNSKSRWTGDITSSKNLMTDPENIGRIARGSEYVVEIPHTKGAQEVLAAMEAEGLNVSIRNFDPPDGSKVSPAATLEAGRVPVVVRQRLRALIEIASPVRYRPTPGINTVPESGLTPEILAQLSNILDID